jgi:hypothetical protein
MDKIAPVPKSDDSARDDCGMRIGLAGYWLNTPLSAVATDSLKEDAPYARESHNNGERKKVLTGFHRSGSTKTNYVQSK